METNNNNNTNNYQILILRTGTANIGSITAAFIRLFPDATINTLDIMNMKEDSPLLHDIIDASHVIVPGVGTFGATLQTLQLHNCKSLLLKRLEQAKPTLWICVGLQILAKTSQESPNVLGLDVLSNAQVSKFSEKVKVPQQGWNRLFPNANSRFIRDSFGSSSSSGSGTPYCYFSNSYKLDVGQVPEGWIPTMAYYGEPFVAAVEKGNVMACQFHPELSGKYGLDLLSNWVLTTSGKPSASSATSPTTPASLNFLTHRIIPCLDIKDGKIVKGIQFQHISDAGNPIDRIKEYELQGADEVVMLDISATIEARKTKLNIVKQLRGVISIPLTVGGGISSLEDAKELMESGADKVAMNSAAVKNPQLITQVSSHFGRQCTVISLDAAQRTDGKGWEVVIQAGKVRTGLDAVEWAKTCVEYGCGEILLTSWDKDGTKSGYDLELIREIASAVPVPIIASGGAASAQHFVEGLQHGADAVLAASIFHYNEYTVLQLKQELEKLSISVRL